MPSNSPQPVAPRLLLDVREAAAALSISPRSLWAISQPRGTLPVVRIGQRVLFSTDALRRWIEQQQTGNGDQQQAAAQVGAGGEEGPG